MIKVSHRSNLGIARVKLLLIFLTALGLSAPIGTYANTQSFCSLILAGEVPAKPWTPPEPILEIFRQMERAKGRSRIHPVKTLNEAIEAAALDPKSSDAVWWTSPKRKQLKVEEIKMQK